MGDQKGKQEMKLKKAMRLYPIESNDGAFKLGGKTIYQISGRWRNSCSYDTFATGKQAVAWLVEGAAKLSPIQIAMRNNKLIIEIATFTTNTIWILRGRSIQKDNHNENFPWMARSDHYAHNYATEQEAVDWLLTDPEEIKQNVHTYFCVPDYRNALTKRMEEYEKMYSNKPFSTVSILRNSGSSTIHAGHLLAICPICGKIHPL
jgi:hypothetical protein